MLRQSFRYQCFNVAFLPENDVKVLANITVVPVYGTYKRDLNLHKIRTSFCCRQCFVYLVSTRAVNWCIFVSLRFGSEFFSGSGSNFFFLRLVRIVQKSGFHLENPDPWKNVQKLLNTGTVQVEKFCISYLALSTLSVLVSSSKT